jgi:AraC family transcriptional regulator, positive regulator of tynA and feaB
MSSVHSTLGVRVHERLSYWLETASAREVDLKAGPDFRATLRNDSLHEVTVCDLTCDPCEIGRTARNISRAGCDHFFLCMPLDGTAVVSQDDRIAVGRNGGFVLIDTRRPYVMSFQRHTRSVSLVLPRAAIEARLGHAVALPVRAMDAVRPVSGLASGFLSMLPSRIASFEKTTASRLAEVTLDLVALAFALEADELALLSTARNVALFRLKTAIEVQLHNPMLKPAMVAAAAGISVRYANDLLSGQGFSLGRYILHRRLERCRTALEDPAQAHRRVGEIAFAWGFSELSHFIRRFRAAYGLTPRDYRQRAEERACASMSAAQQAPI